MSEADELKKEIDLVDEFVDIQIAAVQTQAASMSISAFDMRNTDGSFTLTPLLLAKSNILVALSNLQ